jgi:hypothetical protein
MSLICQGYIPAANREREAAAEADISSWMLISIAFR